MRHATSTRLCVKIVSAFAKINGVVSYYGSISPSRASDWLQPRPFCCVAPRQIGFFLDISRRIVDLPLTVFPSQMQSRVHPNNELVHDSDFFIFLPPRLFWSLPLSPGLSVLESISATLTCLPCTSNSTVLYGGVSPAALRHLRINISLCASFSIVLSLRCPRSGLCESDLYLRPIAVTEIMVSQAWDASKSKPTSFY